MSGSKADADEIDWALLPWCQLPLGWESAAAGSVRGFLGAYVEPAADSLFWRMMAAQVAEVRWYSFLVLMEELADELACLHSALRELALSLPNTGSAVRCGPRRSFDRDLF